MYLIKSLWVIIKYVYNRETKVPEPVYITYMNWLKSIHYKWRVSYNEWVLYMKIFALLSWVLIFAYFSFLFQNITTYSLEIWVQRLKPKLCGMPSRPLGKYRKSTTIYHIFTTAYYVHTLSQWGQRLYKFALLLSFFLWKPTAQKLDTRPQNIFEPILA